MFKALIIEDEKPAARRLQRMVEENNLEVVDLLHSVSQSITWFESHPAPDLIFLDIQLSDGISFEIFEKIKINSPIIFTTAYDSYTLKAFKLNSIDYLLKPIDPDELKQSIQKFQNQNPTSTNQNHAFSLEIQKIKELLYQNKTYKERFTVYVGSLIKLLEVQDIECIISVEKATYAYTFQGKSFLLEGSLESVCDQLNPKNFFRANRKHIINLNGIQEIIAYSNQRLQVKLKNFREEEIIVSREKVKDFKDWLD
jgi:two-component system response regulator LytT